MEEKKIHFFGVLLGMAVDHFGSFLSYGLMGAAYVSYKQLGENDLNQIYSDSGFMLVLLAVGMLWSFFGGYVAAFMAKRAERFHASIIGVVGAAIGFHSLITDNDVPLWYQILGLLIIIPVSLLGGQLALRRRKVKTK